MDLTTRQLRSFIVLAEELSFTRAAERLMIPQQALSGQIRRLELRVGFPLFERSTRHVALTPAGERFASAATSALGVLERAVDAGRDGDLGRRRTLRVGYIEDVARELTEPILRTFRDRHPDVAVQLVGADYTDPSCGLRDASVDVSFVRLPIDASELSFEPLFGEPLLLGVHARHPLAGLPSVRMSQLVDLPFVTPATGDAAWESFWTLEAYAPGRRRRASESGAIVRTAAGELQAVAAGSACALVPWGAVRLNKTGTIVTVPIEDGPRSEVALAWRSDDDNELLAGFRDAVRSAVEQHADLVLLIEDGPRTSLDPRLPAG